MILVHGNETFMRAKTVITLIKQLMKKFGGYEKVATELGITARYVRHLEKGEKVPSESLRKLIKILLKIRVKL